MRKFIERLTDKKNILIIGDIMLDNYIHGVVERISPEAPVPVFKFTHEELRLGGAANVANNLAYLNQNVYLMGVVGDDLNGGKLVDFLNKNHIHSDFIVRDSSRSTSQKVRYVVDTKQQILRMDIEDTHDISDEIQNRLMDLLSKKILCFNLIIISDYLKGMLPFDFTQKVVQLANKNGIRTLVDPKDKNFLKYKDAYLIKPNKKELKEMLNIALKSEEEIIVGLQKIKEKLNLTSIVVTRGDEGMTYLDQDDKIYNLPTKAKEVYDVTGAGDTVISYLALCLANGVENIEAIKIANIAAGIKVGRMGTSVVQLQEVEEKLLSYDEFNKMVTLNEIKLISRAVQLNGKKVVFTNGCFDILHSGHIIYLEKAKSLGDILIVGLNSDNSIKRLKGENRPIIREENRVLLLAALKFIDYIVIFDEDTPYNLIREIQPNILVKGGDYTPDNVVGKDIVEEHGGRVEILPFIEGEATTNIINRILEVYGNKEERRQNG